MARICVLCFKYTARNLPFCKEHYEEFKDVIDQAIENKEEWLTELERMTQKERRRLARSREYLPLKVLGEEY